MQLPGEFDIVIQVPSVEFPPAAQTDLRRSREAQPNYHNLVPPHRLLVVVLIENMTNKETNAVLTSGDVEAIERVIYRNGDDIAMSMGRSFERLEEKIEAADSRIYARLTEIENELKAELVALRLLAEGDSEVVIGEK